MDRRRFLKDSGRAALAAAGLGVARAVSPLPHLAGRTVRVRGRVHAAGKGLPGVAISDGLSIVMTGPDGTYELVSSAARRFVQVSVPSGYRVPVHPTGTARFFVPLAPDDSGEASASFEFERLPRDDARHAILVLGDIQTQDADEVRWFHEQAVPDILETRRSLDGQEVLGLAMGDIMYDNLEFFPDYERAVSRIGVPFFQVVGNHDVDQHEPVDERSSRTFESYFGPRYYSFDRGAIHYVVLDDIFWHGDGYIGYLDLEQLVWLQADLARIETGRTVVVALHIPALGSYFRRDGRSKPDTTRSVTNRDALFRLLEPYRAHVLAGHMHESEHLFEGQRHEHVVGAVCGAWWSGPICGDGTPCGYAVYEVRGEEVGWRYKSAGRPASEQMRVYPRGTDPASRDEILVNIWDWDPGWQVFWYEEGVRRGALAQRKGFDPLSVELHRGPDLPARRKWVEPYPTEHLFYAAASRRARRITIEARDRFGRVYTAEIAGTP